MKKLFGGPAKYPLIVALVATVLFALGWWLLADTHIPVLMPSGQVASQQRDLIIFTVLLAAVVVVPVFVLLGVFSWKYREGNKKAKYQPEKADNKVLELIWWGIPVVIILVLSIVTWVTSHTLDPYRAIESETETLEIQVVALQWKWLFIYPDQGVATVNDLTIPVDTPVHFTLSADAPMSAFWIPDLGSEIYSMNGMSSQLHLIADDVGLWTGYNTNINGEGYVDMTFAVHAVNQDEFSAWHKKHATSGHELNEMHLAELSKPSIISEPMYMSLPNADIYDTIIMKYMGGGMPEDGATMEDMSGMDMSGGSH